MAIEVWTKQGLALVAAVLFTGTMASHTVRAATPDLAACERGALIEEGADLEREIALHVPEGMEAIIASSFLRIAVSTLDGATVCVPTGSIDLIDGPIVLFDGRFLGIPWVGYEANGYLLVDRMGKGSVREIGAPPSFSRFEERLASVEGSGSGFGALNGVLILDVREGGLFELARLTDLPAGYDWKIERWSDDGDCLEISSYPIEAMNGWQPSRIQSVSNEESGWQINPLDSHCPNP